MAEISVIVPIYKVEKYIDQCIQSILEQTFSDYELYLLMMVRQTTAVEYVMNTQKEINAYM